MPRYRVLLPQTLCRALNERENDEIAETQTKVDERGNLDHGMTSVAPGDAARLRRRRSLARCERDGLSKISPLRVVHCNTLSSKMQLAEGL